MEQLSPSGDAVGRFTWERAIRDAADVTGMTLAVALLVSTYAGSDGRGARPAVYTLGQQLGLAVSDDNRCRPVSKHLARLVEHGWLTRSSRGAAGRPATYSLTMPDRAPTSTLDRAPRGTPNRAPTSTLPASDRAHRSTEPCSQNPGNRAHRSTPPTQDQYKTNPRTRDAVGDVRAALLAEGTSADLVNELLQHALDDPETASPRRLLKSPTYRAEAAAAVTARRQQTRRTASTSELDALRADPVAATIVDELASSYAHDPGRLVAAVRQELAERRREQVSA